MLILSRKVNEGIIIGDLIHIKVTRIDGDAEIYQNGHTGSLKSSGIKADRVVPLPKPATQPVEDKLPVV
jgi:hypothetical protein